MNATSAPAKPPRFPQLTLEQLNPEQRKLADEIMKFSRVGIGGPYNIMLRSPVFLRRMLDLLDYLRWNTSLPLYLNEFAILIVGRRWRSQVEWYAHVPIAMQAGLSEAIIADLKQKRRPEGMKDAEAIVYDFCAELAANHAVSDETFARAKRILGEQQVVDLVAVSGTYVTVAMLLSVAEAMPPEGKELPFKEGEE
jgi:4-carboxymuconolactone decarboxylase